ncbi:choice-of-anchor Q domain-containing protein [Tautonia plasticadhaerens]|uniref:FG-GAP repeat protein n=1 Tax=Tautonia plasticadhaerens TaxID=2527974 RepID=A0A518HE53_9BACT|nr:choice-of-anchor Q domain-containing protein [Tautonia plasticadhaerens]QDV39134.1 FG-GAP repeat protein [Tautonia plasticadhaerens]
MSPNTTRRRAGRTDRRTHPAHPRPEPMEPRRLLAMIPVASLADAGPGTLRSAIELANLDPARDTIEFAPSLTGTIALSGALPELSSACDLAGPGASVLTVARGAEPGTPTFRIFAVPQGSVVTISGLTIAGGWALSGGGIDNAGTLTVRDCAVRGNTAYSRSEVLGSHGRGGGIHNSGTLTVRDCAVRDNAAYSRSEVLGSHGRGGGIYNSGTLTVVATTLSGNLATGLGDYKLVGGSGSGGGIDNSGTLAVIDSTLSGNSARGNFVGSGRGGGIRNAGTLELTRSTLMGNTAHVQDALMGGSSLGGGIDNAGTLTVTASTLSGNSATIDPGSPWGGVARGGGIGNAGTLTVTASTLADNSAGGDGGGIATDGEGSTLTIASSIFGDAGGGTLAVLGGALVSRGHNLLTDAPALALDPTDRVDIDPLLAPLGAYGGPTPTHALLPGSPAIDAAIPVAGVAADQRGVPRPQGSAPDIGAFESRGFSLAIAAGDRQVTPASTPFPEPLALAVASPFAEPTAGGRVTFASPPTGASAVLEGSPAAIDAAGRAGVTATANGVGGAYAVTARAAGAGEVPFALTNVVASIVLAPATVTGLVGQARTVTATVLDQDGRPLAGIPVAFRIVAGPNSAATGVVAPADGRTDADGHVRFSYPGRRAGIDTIEASTTLGRLTVGPVTTAVGRPRRPAPADSDGDGRSDRATYALDPAAGLGRFTIELSAGGTRALAFGGPGDRPVVADFDGDRIADPAVYGPGPDGINRLAYLRSSDGAARAVAFGGPGDRPVIGDFDGDGVDDLAVYGPGPDGIARFAVRPAADPAGAYAVPFGGPDDTPLAGDFDGDGRADLAVYGPGPRDGSSRFAIRPTGDPAAGFAVPFGGAGDGPVVGDYDGDGRDDVVVYGFSPLDGLIRFGILPSGPNDATFSRARGAFPVAFGGEQDAPLAADSDGDGRTDVAVYGFSPLDGAARFAILRSSDGRGASAALGTADSVGLPAAPGWSWWATRGGEASVGLRASPSAVTEAEAAGVAAGAAKPRRIRLQTEWARLVDAVLSG